jgi:excinuclease UvrABC ATPase subunit
MNYLNEISKIRTLMGINESNKYDLLKETLQKLINNTINKVREESQDWGLGEMDEIDEIESIEKIEIDRIVNYTRMVIYVKIFVKSQRRDFDNIMDEINYTIQKYIPNSFVQVDDIVDNRTFGPGIDW